MWFLIYLAVLSNAPGGFGAQVLDNLPFTSLEACAEVANREQEKAAQANLPLRAICGYSEATKARPQS